MNTVSLFQMKPEFVQQYGGRSFVSLRVELSESSLYPLYELAWTGTTDELGLETTSSTDSLLDGLYHYAFNQNFPEGYKGRPMCVGDIIVLGGGDDLLSGRRYYYDCGRFQPLESSVIRYFRLRSEFAFLEADLSEVARKATVEQFPFLFDCIGARGTADLFGFDDVTPSIPALMARLVHRPSLLQLSSMAGIVVEVNGTRRFLFNRNQNWLRLDVGRLKRPLNFSDAKILVHDWVLPGIFRVEQLHYYTLRRSDESPYLPITIEPYSETDWNYIYGTLVSDEPIDLGAHRCLILDNQTSERMASMLGGDYQ
ncbi:hypothetical protein ACFQI7_28060 [Paenibacillus allorhizosphaerae]|uniref:Uncharacterized protein n=1 Tax=Paenibacillus allorhizosphaerae TaxID=2849866 RepID=A0ABM8VNJ8_9BACL|nr:hypothetical protein [Paenibacillus allorhizosphaerae]CAG7651571.1 hypothetical protein PAECIP111802_04998 [Paenibacillus allorhizosphaerae]